MFQHFSPYDQPRDLRFCYVMGTYTKALGSSVVGYTNLGIKLVLYIDIWTTPRNLPPRAFLQSNV